MMITVNSSIAQFEEYGLINFWWHARTRANDYAGSRADDYTHRRIVVTL